jgi:non-heme chloroperoxidase
MDSHFELKTVDVNGTQLHYIEEGRGDPLVLVHGGVNDWRSWRLQIGPFSQAYRVIAYSRRYHYPNAVPAELAHYAGAEHRDDLAGLIETLNLAPAYLVSSSYGAYVSLLLAGARPELVRALVLGEPPAFPLLGPAAVDSIMARAISPSRLAFEREDQEQGVRSFINTVIGEGAFDRVPPPVRSMMLDNAPEFRLEVNTPPEKYFSPISCEDIRTIQAPALLLTGELSPQFFHEITDELERCLPNRGRAVIPRASHGMHNMNPQAYNEAVLAFLAKH